MQEIENLQKISITGAELNAALKLINDYYPDLDSERKLVQAYRLAAAKRKTK